MKKVFKRIGIPTVIMALAINLCTLTPAFADDGNQSAFTDNPVPIASTIKVQPRGIGVLPVYYTVSNVRSAASDWVLVGQADGIPTMTLDINRSQAIAITFSATYGATYNQINAAVGWTYGKTVIVEIGGHYTVPVTYNGHKVKSGTLLAYAERSVKAYDVERHNEVGGITRSTGLAKKVVNHLCYKVKLNFTDGCDVTISI